MLLPLSWLREFTPYEGTAQALGDRLTLLGLELEDIKHPFAELGQITTGEVVSCVNHPDSDHLHCCQVNVGQEALLDIVCGAPNVAQGQKVAVATIGTKLPDGTQIKKSKLRGQVSLGMICSERELGLSEDHSGIMVLSEQTKVGQKLSDVLELDSEVLEFSITPNRADCLSILGLARETAMVFHLPLNLPEVKLSLGEQDTEVPLEIEAPDLCWLYAGRILHEVKLGPSPLKLRSRLLACGIRSLSNIVDVTNYVMLECGQPLHAFDLDKLAKAKILVRRASPGEKFITLDKQERLLEPQDLCICDGEKPVALAGVMGGLNSEITSETKTVFLESAVFDPATIRKTSRRLGLGSESSYRFERGIDQLRTTWSLDRAIYLMQKVAGGSIDRRLNLVEAKPFCPQKMTFRVEKASSLLGVEIKPSLAKEVFQGLGCELDLSVEPWKVLQPSWRPDLTREADLIEEVGRVYGLDNIPPKLPPMQFSLEKASTEESEFAFWRRLRQWGAGLGLNEAINYSFVGEKDLDLLGVPLEGRISIKNPLSAEQNVLRPTVAPGLLQSLKVNLAQGALGIRLFELCHGFSEDLSLETHTLETPYLGLLLCGLRHEPVWPYNEEELDYSDLRGILEHLCLFLHLPKPQFEKLESHPYLLPALEIKINQESLGTLGNVLPKVADFYLAQKPVWLAEINLIRLKDLEQKASLHFKPLSIFPAIKRDVTVIGSETLKVGEVLAEISKLKHPLIEDVALVSSYQPEGSQNKHLSFRLTFRHPSRTLKDSEVDKEKDKIVATLTRVLGVRV